MPAVEEPSERPSDAARVSRPRGPEDDATVISGSGSAASRGSSGGSAVSPPGPTMTAEIGRTLEGTMLGPYRLDRFIGGGGMGAVFRALDTTLDRTVAVKVLARQQSDDEELLKRFRNEAQSAARLDHENIGRVHAVGTEEGWHYIVFEFIEGTNLRDIVRDEGPFGLERTVDIAIQVADALEHASEREVVHRDIKPSNIVITPTGRARIVDMGLARLHQVADDRELTVSGMTLGTFDYISPEQARDPRAADVRSDLYSLGCTMFFMLVGRPPFADGTMVQKLLQHQQAEPPAIDAIRSDVPRRLADIIRRLMAKDPADRYQRPAVLVADLLAFADEQGLSLAAPRPAAVASATPAGSPPARRLIWAVPLAGLVTLVGGLWLKSALERRGTAGPSTVIPSGAGLLPVVRVVDAPTAVGERATLAEAVAMVSDGGEIELGFDGLRRSNPIAVEGRRITIRAAAGMQPAVAFTQTALAGDGSRAACDVGDGSLVVRGVGMRLDAPPIDDAVTALFAVGSGSLLIEEAVLRMPGDCRPVAHPRPIDVGAAFVRLVLPAAAASGSGTGGTVTLQRTRAAGDAVLLAVDADSGGTATLRWSEGVFASPHRLVVADGTPGETPLHVDCELVNLVAGCGAGLVWLRDSRASPLAPRLRAQATACRLIVGGADRPFVEQSGVGDPAAYRAACAWLDEGSRYEGSGVFQRIDGAAERQEIFFADLPMTMRVEPQAGPWPDPADWQGWAP